ncbi:MAG: hypothetical protein M3Q07_18615, partial [Pseudobdellovibrionaceae bacterium]|nr:hypothetical protein [Pseudobdellovibrionaceae bacterium]
YRRMVMLLVRQNHYVTEQCQASLAPALDLAGQAKDHVAGFMAAEKGHDLILGSALKSMTDDLSSLPVCLSTRTLMKLLKFVAGRNLLAFAMVIEMFERSSYESIDPLASLLAKGGFDKAASLVNRHKEINDAGGHENIAASFLEFMAPCNPDYALEAMHLAELVSVISNSVTGSVWKLFHEISSGT